MTIGSGVSIVPVRRARVMLEAATGGANRRVSTTDPDGRFVFRDIPPGSYKLNARKAGYIPEAADAGLTPISVSDGQTTDVTIRMTKAAALEGRLTEPDGAPAGDVFVSAFLESGGGASAMRLVRRQRTDGLGRYRLHTLPAGTYHLFAQTEQRAVRPGEIPGTRVAGVFYPGAAKIEGSRAIAVGAGDDVAGVDFVIAKTDARNDITVRPRADSGESARANAAFGSVAGRIVAAESGNPLSGAMVRVQAIEERMFLTTRTDPEGHYEFTDLPAGAYFCGDAKEVVVGQSWQTIDLTLKEGTYQRFMREGASYTMRIPVKGDAKLVKAIVYDYAADLLGTTVAMVR